MKELHKELLRSGFITQSNHDLIEALQQKKVLSLYYELRFVLYIGMMLLTGAIGYLVYQNIGDIGHYAIMFVMLASIGSGTWFIVQKSSPYSNEPVKTGLIYFDYLVVLVSLLVISLFTYIQVYFDMVDVLLQWTSLVSALLFLFMAYRYDNKMVLSLGIVALAAVFGLAISPVNWVNGSWLKGADLYVLSLIFGSLLLVTGQALKYRGIKKHFTFTIHNFGWLTFYFGALAFIFDHADNPVFTLMMIIISVLAAEVTWRVRSFLFFVYASVACYIAAVFLPFTIGLDPTFLIWFIPASFILGVFLLIKNKNHFSDEVE